MWRATTRFMTHPDIGRLYAEFLFASHCVVRASVPLMQAAYERVVPDVEDDPVAAGLARYLPGHIAEEMDHDEWVLQDLESLGVDRSAILARPPSATVAALVGSQYYWIHHFHPVALMGYMAVLEGNPPTQEAIARLVSRTGYASEAFRSLVEHAELDPHHIDDLNQALDSMPLSHEQSTVVGLSATHTVAMLARVFDEIVDGSAGSTNP